MARNSLSSALEEPQSDTTECVRKAWGIEATVTHHRALSPVAAPCRGGGPYPHSCVFAAELVAQPSETFLLPRGQATVTHYGEIFCLGLSRHSVPPLPGWQQQQEACVWEWPVDFPSEVPCGPGVQPGAWRGSALKSAVWSQHISLRFLVTVGQGPAGVPSAMICVMARPWERGHGWTDTRAGVGRTLSQVARSPLPHRGASSTSAGSRQLSRQWVLGPRPPLWALSHLRAEGTCGRGGASGLLVPALWGQPSGSHCSLGSV